MPESCHVFAMEPDPFRALMLGLKTAVVLPLSLGVYVADQLVFREWRPAQGSASEGSAPEGFTGAWTCRRVTHEERGYQAFFAVCAPERLTAGSCGVDLKSAVYSMNNAAENSSAKAHLAHRLTQSRADGLTQEQFWADVHQKEHSRREILRRVG